MIKKVKNLLDYNKYLNKNEKIKNLSIGAKGFLLDLMLEVGISNDWVEIEYENYNKSRPIIESYIKELHTLELIEKEYKPIQGRNKIIPNRLHIRLNLRIEDKDDKDRLIAIEGYI